MGPCSAFWKNKQTNSLLSNCSEVKKHDWLGFSISGVLDVVGRQDK